jgi:hypothetical protein
MSSDLEQAIEHGTKPTLEHAWLQNLIGEWKTEAQVTMPDGSSSTMSGTEVVRDLGGLWALSEGQSDSGGECPMTYVSGIGFDVSFREYRGFWLASMSSHLWKQTGTLSSDGKVMTLDCVGPHMTKDGETANYRDVIELMDRDHRKLTSLAQDDEGNWVPIMTVQYTRM